MKPSAIMDVLPGLMESKQPVFLWGPPGVGKSSIIRALAEKADRALTDIRAVLLDPVDLRGIPHINGEGKARWCPPDFLPSDPDATNIVFLDELAQAAPLVQSACLQLCLDRRIGEYELPDGCAIIAASNRQEDRAGAHRLISPLLNRFVHLTLDISVDDWRQWALANSIDPRIMAYMAMRPDALFQFDPKSSDTSFPTPRSWEFASKALAHTSETHMFPIMEGCVGTGAAAEFCGFAELYGKLPDIDKVLRNPETEQVPDDPSVLYALCGALTAKLRSNPKLGNAYAAYVSRMKPEFAMLAMKDGMNVDPKLIKTMAGAEWMRSNRDLILSAED